MFFEDSQAFLRFDSDQRPPANAGLIVTLTELIPGQSQSAIDGSRHPASLTGRFPIAFVPQGQYNQLAVTNVGDSTHTVTVQRNDERALWTQFDREHFFGERRCRWLTV